MSTAICFVQSYQPPNDGELSTVDRALALYLWVMEAPYSESATSEERQAVWRECLKFAASRAQRKETA